MYLCVKKTPVFNFFLNQPFNSQKGDIILFYFDVDQVSDVAHGPFLVFDLFGFFSFVFVVLFFLANLS